MWTDEKQSRAEAERRERLEQRRSEKRKSQKKEDRNSVFFQWFVAPEGRKVGSLKRRVRSHLARREMNNCTLLWREAHFQVKMYETHHVRTTFGSCDIKKVHAVAVVARSTFPSQNVQNTPILRPLLEVAMSKKCTPLWREAHFEVNMYKAHQLRTTFGSWDVEKVHAVVARSTFPSQNVQTTPRSDHFWKLRCRKSARRCGAKHIPKSKCTKHTICSDHFWKLRCRKSARRCGAKQISKSKCYKTPQAFGPLLEVEMCEKVAGAQLWREAHFEVKMFKANHEGSVPLLEVQTIALRVAGTRDCAMSPTGEHYNVTGFVAFSTTTTFHYTPIQLHYTTTTTTTTLNYTTLRYTTLRSTTLHYTQLHSHYTTLHYTTLHYTPLHYNYNYTTLHFHYTTLHNTTLHYTDTPLHCTTLHYTALHYTTTTTTLHYTTLHSTTFHYTTLH